MDLGQRIKQARLEKGLSQRQVCGEVITRNMLSLIESGKARPGMDTLEYLSRRLGKPLVYFLGETSAQSPNAAYMAQARQAYREGRPLPEGYAGPDEAYDGEYHLLHSLWATAMAERSLRCGDLSAAAQYLQQAEAAAHATPYDTPANAQYRQTLKRLTDTGQFGLPLP